MQPADETSSTPRQAPLPPTPEAPARGMYANDPTLVQRCLDGNQSAWNELVERYGRLIYSIPRRHGLTEEDASDIVQNVFLIVLRNLAKLRQQDHLSAWLITIAQHETLRYTKRTQREVIGEWEFPAEAPHLSGELQQLERAEILQQALERLEQMERKVILALQADPPPSYDELAAKLNIPRGSIGYWRKRALEHLRQYLHELGFDS